MNLFTLMFLGATMLMFQNCSQSDFGTEPASKNSASVTGAGASGAGSVDGDSLGLPNTNSNTTSQPAANTCFQITCVSDANAANTLQAVTDASGMIVRPAPSNGSTWVLKLTTSGLQEGHNCWSDQQVATGAVPDESGIPLCKQYGGTVSLAAPLTFSGGFAKDFRLCEYAPCNSGRAQSALVGNIYSWIMAKPLAGGTASIEIRAASWGAVTPGEFTQTLQLPLGQCATVNFNYEASTTGSFGQTSYALCNNASVITARFSGQQFTLDLNTL